MNGNFQRHARRGIVATAAAALGFALALAGCETVRVGSDYDRAANFASYHSFTWVPREDYGTRNPLVVERARDAIQARLQQKGYTYTSDTAAADFAVDFTIGAHQRTDIHTYPAAYGGDWYWYGANF